MKTIRLFVPVLFFFIGIAAQAQVSVSVNIGSPPLWGPAGYTGVQYYYLPDVEAYYDVPNAMFIYYDNGAWIKRTYLPLRYRNYDLYSGYKVVMHDYHGSTPYIHHNDYKKKYHKGYHGKPQKTIGEKPGYKHSKPGTHEILNHNQRNGKGDDNNKGGKKSQKHKK